MSQQGFSGRIYTQIYFLFQISQTHTHTHTHTDISVADLGFLKGGFQGSERSRTVKFTLKKGRHFFETLSMRINTPNFFPKKKVIAFHK